MEGGAIAFGLGYVLVVCFFYRLLLVVEAYTKSSSLPFVAYLGFLAEALPFASRRLPLKRKVSWGYALIK